MTNIVGLQKASGETLLDGILRVVLDTPIVDRTTTPDSIHSAIVENYIVTAGVVNINLPQSATYNVTYYFQFITLENITTYYLPNGEQYNGVTHIFSGQYYTGATQTIASILLTLIQSQTEKIVDDFHAIVPNVASIEYADLQQTGITTDTLDTSLRRLVEILQGDEDFIQSIRPRQFGAWNSLQFYRYTDTVTYAGSSWTWISLSPGSGVVPSVNPPSNTFWAQTAAKGDPGGTGGQDSPYNAIAWDGDLNAASKNVLRDKFETMAALDSPIFTGNARGVTQSGIDISASLATTSHVYLRILQTLINTALVGNPTAPTQTNGAYNTTLANTQFVKNVTGRYSAIEERFNASPGNSVAGQNRRQLNSIVNNAGDVLEVAGGLFRLRVGSYKVTAISQAYTPGSQKLTVFRNTTPTSFPIVGLNNVSTANCNQYVYLSGQLVVDDELTQYSLVHFIETAITNGLGFYSGVHGASNFYSRIDFTRFD